MRYCRFLFIVGISICLFFFAPSPSGFAYPGEKNLKQLQRGFGNVLFGIQEIPLGVYHYRDKNPVLAVAVGFFDGVGRMFTREMVGLIEIVTAPFYATEKPIYEHEW